MVSSYVVVKIFDEFLYLLFTVYTILLLLIDVYIYYYYAPAPCAHTHCNPRFLG